MKYRLILEPIELIQINIKLTSELKSTKVLKVVIK